jgi:hypothetical protein
VPIFGESREADVRFNRWVFVPGYLFTHWRAALRGAASVPW